MSLTPRVTVIMPVYNRQAYVGAAIESVLAQSYADFELLIIDDGSTDGSDAVIEQYRRRDARLRVYRQPNRGLVFSRNRAVDLAQGELLAYLDSDDLALPRRLERQVEFLDAHPQVGACGSWIEFFGARHGIYRTPTEPAIIRCEQLFRYVVSHGSAMLRRSWVRQEDLTYLPHYVTSEDYDFWVRCTERFPLANIGEVLTRIRIHAEQLSVAQQQLPNMQPLIWRGMLEATGLTPTEDEVAFHREVSQLDGPITAIFITRAERWLQGLLTANVASGYFPEPVFSRVVGERWFYVCYTAVQQGIPAWRSFWDSSLSTPASLTWPRRVKFAVRSLTGR